MATIRFSEQFWSEFEAIIRRLAVVAGQPIASRYDAEIRRSVRQLVEHPGLGTPRKKLGAKVRMLVVSPYLIFYEGAPKARDVAVLRIVDGRRRITRRMIAAGHDAP